jgi:glycosyltransferase involved in cell wall biosynthesis
MPEAYSVVIPAFNAEQTLTAAIESVLMQTIAPTAVIVVDDGSTDRTVEIARTYAPHVTVLQQANAGPGAATTRGIEAVTTPLLACNDADDIWLPDKAAAQLEWLEQHPDVDAVFGHVKAFGQEEVLRVDAQENWGRTTMMMRWTAAVRVGPIVDYHGYCGDMIDWLARARELNMKLTLMPEVLALRRIIPGSLSSDRRTRGKGYLEVAKAAIDRRRSRQA